MSEQYISMLQSIYVKNSDNAGYLTVPCNMSDLVFKLYLHMNKDNIVNKNKIESVMHWKKDYRSWKKYWKELKNKNIIIFLDKNTIMINPHECYSVGVSHDLLIKKWDSLNA